jgi:hypothetical protein
VAVWTKLLEADRFPPGVANEIRAVVDGDGIPLGYREYPSA